MSELPSSNPVSNEPQTKQRRKTLRIVLIVLGATAILVAVGLTIWWLLGLLHQPETVTPSLTEDETIQEIQANANQIFETADSDEQQDLESATEYFEDQKAQTANMAERNRVAIAQMLFYAANSQPELVMRTSREVPVQDLTVDEKLVYCNALINAGNSTELEADAVQECETLIRENSTTTTDGEG